MKKTRSWKHNRKDRKQYGKRNVTKYLTPFMTLDEKYLREEA